MRRSRLLELLGLAVLALCILLVLTGTALAAGGPRAVTVDASKTIGAIRSLQGTHFDPGPAGGTLSNNYIALGVDSIRTHDAGGFGPNMGVGDVDGVNPSLVMFPNWSADPTLPGSYNFGPTDQMIKNILDIGAEVFFRVGRSNVTDGPPYPFIDNFLPGTPSGSGLTTTDPANYVKYGEIVKHVVMHYNNGWANGFHYNIKYWEIWNEPDLLPFWAALTNPPQYQQLYKSVSLAIKSVYPQAKIGGPANTTHNDVAGLEDSFLQFVKDNNLPLDFYSFHFYANHSVNPYDNARYAQRYRDMLDSSGFTKAQVIDTEYGTALDGTPIIGGPAGSALFKGEVQMYMQDAPVARVYSYERIDTSLDKSDLAYGAVGTLNRTPQRLSTTGGDTTGFAVLAGRDEGKRELRVLIANYEISALNMGPLNLGGIPGNNTEQVAIPGLGILGTFTWLDRGTITYQNTDGYNLEIKNIPLGWGDLTVSQYRLDNNNDMTLVGSQTIMKNERSPEGSVLLSGAWTPGGATIRGGVVYDPAPGVAPGMDMVVITGSTGSGSN